MNPSVATQNALNLAARVLIALLYLPQGWGKLMGFAGVTGYIAAKGVPLPGVAAAIAVLVELVFSILLIAGWQTRWVALGIAAFTAVITPIFHNYWAAAGAQHVPQLLNFYKNFAIVGGLLLLGAYGGGGWSLDARREGAVATGAGARQPT